MEKEISRVEARADNGTTYTVIEYQKIIETRLLSGQMSRASGTKRFALSNGGSVNYRDPETFEIVQTGEVIRKIR